MVASEDHARLYRSAWRKLCLHSDGVALGSTVCALHKAGVLRDLERATEALRVDSLVDACGARRGYLHLAMRLLASQGLVAWTGDRGENRHVTLTPLGRSWVAQAPAYAQAPALLEGSAALLAALVAGGPYRGGALAPDLEPAGSSLPLSEQVRLHLWGAPATAAISGLSLADRLPKVSLASPRPVELALDADTAINAALSILEAQGWAEPTSRGARLTPQGALAAAWAVQYHHPASYLATYIRVPDLIFGTVGDDYPPERGASIDGHLNREVDISYSGEVFNRTCRDAFFEVVLPIFDRTPLDDQPRYVADTGCGDGSLLAALFSAIKDRTARGRALDTHPLVLIGVEYSPLAREAAARKLRAAGCPHMIVSGDIGDPEGIARELAGEGVDMRAALHVSKSVIHDRFYRGARGSGRKDGEMPGSSAIFVTETGGLIESRDMADDLVRHFARWRPWAARHGMAVIESHTVDPRIAAMHIGQSLVTALDASHGYSHQYLVELEFFRWAARRAGFHAMASRELAAEMVGLPLISIDHFVAV